MTQHFRATVRRLADHVAEAVVLLTRVPVPWRFVPSAGRAAWAYPVVGALVGAAVGAAAALGVRLGLGAALSAGWALAVSLLLTGALHEDGLADTADGIGGGRTVERRLAIMRDSRIGSFGCLALVLSAGLRWSALTAIGQAGGQAGGQSGGQAGGMHAYGVGLVAAAAAAGALARCAMLPPLRLPLARGDGMAAALGQVPGRAVAGGWACGVVLALALLPWRRAVPALLLAAVAGMALSRVGRRALGGRTGDLLGAAEQVAECAVLTLLAR